MHKPRICWQVHCKNPGHKLNASGLWSSQCTPYKHQFEEHRIYWRLQGSETRALKASSVQISPACSLGANHQRRRQHTVENRKAFFQFSYTHWMASFSVNCFSNSCSYKVNTDMFTGADLQSRYAFSAPLLPAPLSGTPLLLASTSTVGGNESVEILVLPVFSKCFPTRY